MSGLADRIVEALGDGVFAVDRAWAVTVWNARIAALTGVSADRILGRRLFDVVPGWRLVEHRHLARALGGSVVVSPEFPLVTTGRYEATYTPLDDGALAIVRDVSATDLARYQLRESDLRFRIMADSAPVLLWMAGNDGQCTFFNQPWLEFTGRTLAQELGSGWAAGVHPEDAPRCMDVYLTAFVTRRPYRMEYRLRRRDGEYRWLLDTGAPRYQATGAFVGFVGSCVDITEAKRLRDELDRLVRERTADLETLISWVSHDLREPLLELARLSRIEIHRAPCDLSLLARTAIAELRAREPARAVDVAIEDGLVVDADEGLMRIAVGNLLGNAWKLTRAAASPRIALTAVDHAGERVFAVADNGAGFDAAHARTLFGPGTDVGLATVHRIVSRHGGRVWGEGELGRGATIFLSLP